MQAEPKKGLAALIISSKPKDEAMSHDEPMGDDSKEEKAEEEGKDHAVKEMMDAMKSGDAASFKMALENFLSMCDND